MITKISRGARPLGLMQYLAGPGHDKVHHSQRLIDSSFGVEPAPLTPELVEQLADDLAWPARAFPDVAVWDGQGAVWHCSLALAADEPDLSDAKWAEVSRDFMEGMGFPGDARWVVVGHGASANGNPHVHIAASLVTESGGTVDPFRDKPRSRLVANDLAHKHGLKLIASEQPGGPESQRSVSQAEIARGRGRRDLEPTLRAAAALGTEQQFLEALALTDTPVRPFPQTEAKHVTGYSVRIDDVWFGGGKVARDLSLPRLRANWTGPPVEHAGWSNTRAVFPLLFLATKSAEQKRQRIRLMLIANAKTPRAAAGRRVERRGSMTDIEDSMVAPLLDAAAVTAAVATSRKGKQQQQQGQTILATSDPGGQLKEVSELPPIPVADQVATKMAADHKAQALGPITPEQKAHLEQLVVDLDIPMATVGDLSQAHADNLIRAFEQARDPSQAAVDATFGSASDLGHGLHQSDQQNPERGYVDPFAADKAERKLAEMQGGWSQPSAESPAIAAAFAEYPRETTLERLGYAPGETVQASAQGIPIPKLTPGQAYDKAVQEGRAPANWKTGDAQMSAAQRDRLVHLGVDPSKLVGLTKATASEMITAQVGQGKSARPAAKHHENQVPETKAQQMNKNKAKNLGRG